MLITSYSTVKELSSINMEAFLSLNERELTTAVKRLSSIANRRIELMERRNIKSPAIEANKRKGGKFTIKGKNLDGLRAEYIRAVNFLKLETSTISGYNKVKKRVIKQLMKNDKKIVVKMSDYERLFDIYESLKEFNPSVNMQRLKYGVLDEINKYIKDDNMDFDIILNKIKNQVNKIYEEEVEKAHGESNILKEISERLSL